MNNDGLLAQASTLIRQGRGGEAQQILREMLRENPQDGRVFALMSLVVEDQDKRRYCLEQAIALSTDDEQTTAWAGEQLASISAREPAKPDPKEAAGRSLPRVAVLAVLNVVLVSIVVFLAMAVFNNRTLSTLLAAPTAYPTPTSLPLASPTPFPEAVVPTLDLDPTLTASPKDAGIDELLPLEDRVAVPFSWAKINREKITVASNEGRDLAHLRYGLKISLLALNPHSANSTNGVVQVLIYDDDAMAADAYSDLARRASESTRVNEPETGALESGEYQLFINSDPTPHRSANLDETLTGFVYQHCKLVFAYEFDEYEDPDFPDTETLPVSIKMDMFRETESNLADVTGCVSQN